MLNVTSEAIVRLCDGSMTVPQIATRLMESYNAPRELIEGDIGKLLERLSQLNLLTLAESDASSASSV